jgi:hypothetical protein
MNLRLPKNAGSFLSSFSGEPLLRGVLYEIKVKLDTGTKWEEFIYP